MAQKESEAMRALLAFFEEPEVEVGRGVLSGGGGHCKPASRDNPGEGCLFLSSTEQCLVAHSSFLWAVEGQLGSGGAGELLQSSREGPRPNLG